jgi:hypothetical protein
LNRPFLAKGTVLVDGNEIDKRSVIAASRADPAQGKGKRFN